MVLMPSAEYGTTGCFVSLLVAVVNNTAMNSLCILDTELLQLSAQDKSLQKQRVVTGFFNEPVLGS